jgi:hypothetical protein
VLWNVVRRRGFQLSPALHRAYRQCSNSVLQCRSWVKSGQTVPGQNPLLSALVQKRTRFQPSGVQGKLVLLCNRGVRPCKIMPIPSYRHPNGCSGTKGN